MTVSAIMAMETYVDYKVGSIGLLISFSLVVSEGKKCRIYLHEQ